MGCLQQVLVGSAPLCKRTWLLGARALCALPCIGRPGSRAQSTVCDQFSYELALRSLQHVRESASTGDVTLHLQQRLGGKPVAAVTLNCVR